MTKEKMRTEKLAVINKNLKKDRNELSESINRVASTVDGIIMLRHLKELCGWDKSDIVFGNKLDVDATLRNCNVRNIYRVIRDYIDKENLIKIEFNNRRD
jgi:hypothetical protein